MTCFADERATELFPHAFAAVLKVRTRGGAVLEHRVDSSRGGPQHPLSTVELTVKLEANAGQRAAGLAKAVLSGATAAELNRLLIE